MFWLPQQLQKSQFSAKPEAYQQNEIRSLRDWYCCAVDLLLLLCNEIWPPLQIGDGYEPIKFFAKHLPLSLIYIEIKNFVTHLLFWPNVLGASVLALGMLFPHSLVLSEAWLGLAWAEQKCSQTDTHTDRQTHWLVTYCFHQG